MNRFLNKIASLTFLILVLPVSALQGASPNIVISQIYGGGGNAGATYRNDFIELFNRGTTTVDVTGWTVQYAPATGGTWQSTSLSGTIPPGKYYLVQEAQGTGGTTDLPLPDATGSIPINANNGKVALIKSLTALGSNCPSSTDILDIVGYGSADCYEGNTAAALTNITALFRASAGYTDTDNNAADFSTGSPNPRNSSSPVNSFGSSEPLIFAQFADGGGWASNFLLTNPTTTDTTATLAFYGDSGIPLAITIDGMASTTYQVTVPANGATKITTSGVGSGVGSYAATGWVSLTTSPPVDLNANAVFQYFEGSNLLCEASIPGVVPVPSSEFYADEEGGFKTGIALANSGNSTAEGTITLRRKDGTVYGISPISLPARNHTAIYIWQLFGENAPSGRAEVTLTSGFLAAMAIRFHSSVFSTVTVGQPGFAQAGATALFSPAGGVRNRLVAEINRAQSTIDIAIYSFTADAIRDALIAAKSRGVVIRIIADKDQADEAGGEIAALEGLGFNVKRSSGGSGGIMHNKYMIIDGKLLLTGSYNWSAAAEDSNFENAIFLQGTSLIQKYQADFEKIWSR
jgi:hypothetical protein